MNMDERLREMLKGKSYPLGSVSEAVESWIEFVDLTIEGYPYDFPSYMHTLMIRNLLDKIESEFSNDPDWKSLSKPLAEADAKLKDFLSQGPRIQEDSAPWWERRLPPAGSKNFADDVERMCDLKIGIMEE